MPNPFSPRAALLLLFTAGLGACAATPAVTAPRVTSCEQLADGLQWGEGPCLLPDGRLIFADIPAKRVLAWSPGKGLSLWRESAGLANGHVLAEGGSVLVCEEGARRVVRLDADGRLLGVLCERDAEGRRLNSPNDLCLGPLGRVYFSDPTFGIRNHPELKEQPANSVFSCRPDGADLRRESGAELLQPNGLAFGPHQRALFVADSKAGKVLRYAVDKAGRLGPSTVFCQAQADGVRVDGRSLVYLACGDGVRIHRPDGTLLALLPVPGGAVNLCFGDPKPSVLFVTGPRACYKVGVGW